MEKTAPRQSDNPEERLDLVNEQDEVVGSLTRREIYAQGLRNYRVVHAFIINEVGKLWIPRRVASKKLYPNGLDFSFAGHVESGETYEEGLYKEAQEEVGLDLTVIAFKEIGVFNPYKHNVHCFQKVYEIKSNNAPEYNPGDFSGYQWLLPREIIQRFKHGEIGKSDIPEVVRLCYLS